jgi:hypothetical protein
MSNSSVPNNGYRVIPSYSTYLRHGRGLNVEPNLHNPHPVPRLRVPVGAYRVATLCGRPVAACVG